MRSLGSFLVVLGIVATVFGFMDRVPRVLAWMYNWGEGAAWGIKIGLIVLGAILYLTSKPKTNA